jgi:hypothetical protein
MSQLNSSSEQTSSRCLVRSDLLQVGDVILTRGADIASTLIAKWTAGEFSHAALCIERGMILESDGTIIRHKLLLHFGFVKINDALKNVSQLPDNPSKAAVYRHPEIETVRDQLTEAVRLLMEGDLGKNYSELFRLVALLNLDHSVSSILTSLSRALEKKMETNVPGPFCSELIAKFYQRLNLQLFDDQRPPERVSPNDLASSRLCPVSDVVVESAVIPIYPATPTQLSQERTLDRVGQMIASNLNGSRSISRVLKDNEPFFAAQHEQTLAGARALADVMLDRVKIISSFIDASRALPSPHLARAERLGAEAAAILVDMLDTRAETIIRDSKLMSVLTSRILANIRSQRRCSALQESAKEKSSLAKPAGGLWQSYTRGRRRKERMQSLLRTRRLVAEDIEDQKTITSFLLWDPFKQADAVGWVHDAKESSKGIGEKQEE